MERIAIIAALSTGTRALGKDNALLWHIPDDLKRFKQLTLGHPVIMGRKTFESIVAVLGEALPGRTNIVVTRDAKWTFDDVIVMHSLESAIAKARGLDSTEIFIGGGAQIYAETLPYANRLYLTLVEERKEGDAFFPPYEQEFTKIVSDETHEWNGLKYRWVTLERT